MAKKKQEGAVWFRMFRNIRNVVDAVPDESAGAALKAVFAYFDTGEMPENLDTVKQNVWWAWMEIHGQHM